MLHPDKIDPVSERAEYEKATSLMKELIEANEVLSNPDSRRRYDSERSFSRNDGPQAGTPPSPPQPATPPPPQSKTEFKWKGLSPKVTSSFTWIFQKLLIVFVIVFWGGIAIAVISAIRNPSSNSNAERRLTPREIEQQRTAEIIRQANELIKSAETTPSPALASPTPTTKEVRFPRHGTTRFYTDEERIAGLKLDTPSGNLYLILLKDASSGRKMATMYVHGGQAFETNVPLGNYILMYATGQQWYGNKEKFGHGMVVKKFDTVMNFRIQGNQVVGKVVSFSLVANGNLKSTAINPEELD